MQTPAPRAAALYEEILPTARAEPPRRSLLAPPPPVPENGPSRNRTDRAESVKSTRRCCLASGRPRAPHAGPEPPRAGERLLLCKTREAATQGKRTASATSEPARRHGSRAPRDPVPLPPQPHYLRRGRAAAAGTGRRRVGARRGSGRGAVQPRAPYFPHHGQAGRVPEEDAATRCAHTALPRERRLLSGAPLPLPFLTSSFRGGRWGQGGVEPLGRGGLALLVVALKEAVERAAGLSGAGGPSALCFWKPSRRAWLRCG